MKPFLYSVFFARHFASNPMHLVALSHTENERVTTAREDAQGVSEERWRNETSHPPPRRSKERVHTTRVMQRNGTRWENWAIFAEYSYE